MTGIEGLNLSMKSYIILRFLPNPTLSQIILVAEALLHLLVHNFPYIEHILGLW